MSDKPSLYVVEKKEVIILVVLFVLVTVLSFTMGVRYGESVGKKAAHEQAEAQKAAGAGEADQIGGKLSDDPHGESHGDKKEEADSHGAPASGHGTAGAKPADSHSPEVAGVPANSPPAKEAVDKNSDEYLLEALKESGVEPPGGKTPGDAKLPQDVKRVVSGAYVVQVGSHPTRSEAENQVRQLKAKKVDAQILPPAKEKQGQWHRVVVGSFKSKREAEKEAAQLKSRGVILSFYVWRLP